MGSLSDFKITDADISQKGMAAAPDKLTGTTKENKEIFDRLIREVVKVKYNEMVDALEADISDYLGGTEDARRAAEAGRAENEEERVSHEAERVAAEQGREAAEAARNVWEPYDAAKRYQAGNKVVYDGSSYLCLAPCAGVPPEDTACWRLIAGKGVSPTAETVATRGGHLVTFRYGGDESVSFQVLDGTGAGDMRENVYDPQGRRTDVFAYADTKAPLVDGKVPEACLPDLGGKPVRIVFAAEDWTAGTDESTLTVAAEAHGITGELVMFRFSHLIDGAYVSGTWACAESWAEIDGETRAVTLHGPRGGYAGAVTLLG